MTEKEAAFDKFLAEHNICCESCIFYSNNSEGEYPQSDSCTRGALLEYRNQSEVCGYWMEKE